MSDVQGVMGAPKVSEPPEMSSSKSMPVIDQKTSSLSLDKVEEKAQEYSKKNSGIRSKTINKSESIPSKGLSYPEGWSITYRSYVFGEIQDINSEDKSVEEKYKIGYSGIECQGFDKDKLTLQDFMYVMLLRRLLTIGSTKVVIQTFCMGCGNEVKNDFETSNLEFQDLTIDKLPIIVDFSDGEAVFLPITAGTHFKTLESGKSIDTDLSSYLAYELCEGSSELSYEDAYNRLFNLADQDDMDLLVDVDKLGSHGVMPILITCTNKVASEEGGDKTVCGAQRYVSPVNFLDTFILPFHGDERKRFLESKIRFGT